MRQHVCYARCQAGLGNAWYACYHMVHYGVLVYDAKVPWYGTLQYCIVWYGEVWYGQVWYGMVRYGELQYGMVHYDMVLYAKVWQ